MPLAEEPLLVSRFGPGSVLFLSKSNLEDGYVQLLLFGSWATQPVEHQMARSLVPPDNRDPILFTVFGGNDVGFSPLLGISIAQQLVCNFSWRSQSESMER